MAIAAPVCQPLLHGPSRRAWDESQEQLLGQGLLGDPVRLAEGLTAAWHGVQNHREAKDSTLDWLLWYNGSRMHSTLRYLSPSEFEQQATARQLALSA
jgi:transposase InsO family protein